MQQVADWLEKLGLGQYAQRFAENDISFSVLHDLTDQGLDDRDEARGRSMICGVTASARNDQQGQSPWCWQVDQ